jgi:hypothetical protein
MGGALHDPPRKGRVSGGDAATLCRPPACATSLPLLPLLALVGWVWVAWAVWGRPCP